MKCLTWLNVFILAIVVSACAPSAPSSPIPVPTLSPISSSAQTAAWKKIVGKYVTFEYPPTWEPAPAPLFGGAIWEDWRLGIPNGEPDQGLGFSVVSPQEARPHDIISEKAITIGGRPGFKWIRSGASYIHYDYFTTGYHDQGSFSVEVGVEQKDDLLEAQLDRLVQSIVFNSPTEGVIYQIVWSPDGAMIAAVMNKGIRLYDHSTLSLSQTIDEGEYTESVAFSPDSARLACVCGEGLIKIWDVKSGQLLKTLTDEKFFTSVAFNPNGTQIAGGNHAGGVKVWDARGDKLLFALEGLYVNVYPLTFSPDGKRILAGSSLSGAVKVWDASTGQLLHAFPEYSEFFGIEFSPDGTRMATSNIGGEVIKVWDVNNGQLLTTITQIQVIRFALSPDGKQVICACNGGIQVWDVDGGKQIGTLASNDPSVYSIAVSPDGKQLAVGTVDGFIKLLSMPHNPTPPPSPKTALGGFPFPVGATWVYSRVQYQQVIGDPTQIMTATNLITETVVRAEGNIPSQEFLYKQTASLVSAPPGWQDNSSNFNREDWYRIDGTQVFSSPEGFRQINMLLYDFPFAVGKSWCPEQPPPMYNPTCSSMGKRTVEKQSNDTTPVGNFDDCYEISEDINSGGVTEWFCNGIGVVARKYDHSGTHFGFQDTLIRFAVGSPSP